ncbi:hypothetical protein GGI12_005540, partial [Dipsacomyces acuminosporus]
HGAAVIPKASSMGRLKENISVLEMELSGGDMAELDSIPHEPARHFCWSGERVA